MGFNGVNPWIVKMFDLGWLEIIQWFGVVWIINVEGWIGLGGLDLYGGNGLVGFGWDSGPFAGLALGQSLKECCRAFRCKTTFPSCRLLCLITYRGYTPYPSSA